MNFARFWARGECEGQISWRWSNVNVDHARRLALEAARAMAERIRNGDIPRRQPGYYPGRPFREPIIRELHNPARELLGVVSRNSYGSLVLNTARIMFVDIDLPEPKPSGGFFKKLFGKPDLSPPSNPGRDAILKVEQWTRRRPEWGWRIYRTRAGLRLLATHALFEPEAAAVQEVFESFGADPLYRQLCKAQKSFRARLTPKPWRCGSRVPPERWPFSSPKAESRFQQWEAGYEKVCAHHATCELLQTTGSRDIHPDVQLVVQLHDDTTRAGSKLDLA